MGIGDILELLLTFGVLLAIWVVPRLALASRERRRRDPARKSEGEQKTGKAETDAYDWDEETAARWVERQRGREVETGEAAAALYEPERETESLLAVRVETPPAPVKTAAGSRRGNLRRAVIWKEILDAPRALRPFEDREGSA